MSMKPESQHMDDIIVPDIEITQGWAVSEIETREDCDDAFAYLMSAMAEIEYRLEIHTLGVSVSQDPMWPARARRALKYKKAALQLVTQKRGRIEDARRRAKQTAHDKVLLDHIKSAVGAVQFMQFVISSGVDRADLNEVAA